MPHKNTGAYAVRLILGLAFTLVALQSPSQTDRSNRPDDLLREARQWMQAGSGFAARRDIEKALKLTPESSKKADLLALMMETAFTDREYESAGNAAGHLIRLFPNDCRLDRALFIRGASAYQLGRVPDAIGDLTLCLDRAPEDNLRGEALYWRAMCRLDAGEYASAEMDLRRAYSDSLLVSVHDNTLLGWALSLERRGAYEEAVGKLERLIGDFPGSAYLTDARIRLSSLSLRLGRPERALEVLAVTRPDHESQEEEAGILAAGALFQLGRYAEAVEKYTAFLGRFPGDELSRIARFGLAWALVKDGRLREAGDVFQSLAHGTDSLAVASRYLSGTVAFLEGNTALAKERYDSLVRITMYDVTSELAYYAMGLIDYRAGRFRDARRNFQLAARLYPEGKRRSESYRMFGESCMAIGDFANAQFAFSQVRRISTSPELVGAARFQEGVALYHLGRFRTCAERFETFIREYPDHPRSAEALVWRGEALYQDGRFDEAERSYSTVIRRHPGSPLHEEAMYGLAWTLFEQKKFSQAAEAFERYTNSYPETERLHEASLRRADCYFFLGDYDRASDLYSRITRQTADGLNAEYAAFQLAMSMIQRGQTERGIDQLRSFLVKYPHSPYCEIVQFNIGWTFFSNGIYESAIAEFRILESRYPESQLMPRVLFNTGDAWYNLNRFDSARVYYRRVIEEYSAHPLVTDAINGLQYAYQAEGNPSAALPIIERYLSREQTGTTREELLLRKGDILFGEGDIAGAVREYERLLGMQPSPSVQARAFYQLGRSYELENNPARAMRYYEQILSDVADSVIGPQAALSLALLNIKSKRYGSAITMLTEFEQRHPRSALLPEIRFQRGIALERLPDRSKALDQFLVVIREHPGDIFADRSKIEIGRILQAMKRFQASIDTLDLIVAGRSDDLAAEALLIIGENYLSLKRPSDALQAFTDVIEQYAEFPLLVERAYLGAGESHERLGNRAKARGAYEQVARTAVDPVIKKDAQNRLKGFR